ncbi:MAG: ribonuclease III [Burkholderiaceae bacterium]|jgi:ribonuclease-3
MDAQALQIALGYEFSSKALLQQALTHRSHSGTHNERLEFLGDSILNCVVASLLFERFAKIDEGDLSRLRANLVKQQSLYEIAQRLELSQWLRLGEGELKSGGFRRPSILADTVEALFGAIFLDGGFDAARNTIRRLYVPVLETVDPKTLGKDAKTLLQEYLQSRKIALPVYTVVATHGAAHSQEFEVECAVPKLTIQVLGSGGSRRAAEQAAAKKALEAAQALALQASKRTRRPKQAQLSLSVAVTQAAAPAGAAPVVPAAIKAGKTSSVDAKGQEKTSLEKGAEKVAERAPEKTAEKVGERVLEKAADRAVEKRLEKVEKQTEPDEKGAGEPALEVLATGAQIAALPATGASAPREAAAKEANEPSKLKARAA